MIVCVCNAITETEVRDAARAGATCPEAAYARHGCDTTGAVPAALFYWNFLKNEKKKFAL